ncbi:MAG: hypothetical protein HY727_12270 [Candidatus Rokubacteria bacterium]|nr:hypothetical protein [Candidatus Rokubacteria bacterium]
MGKINWSRVFLGGLVAWVVAILLGGVAMFLYVRTEVTATWKGLGLEFPQGPGLAVFWLVFVYVAVVMAIWLYAAIRPRYGPGVKTAVGAGLAFWLIGKFLHTMFLGAVGVYPIRFVVISMATDLVVTVAATVAGAWMYKEE